METTIDNESTGMDTQTPQRPEFLKILCILSFVACGLWILGLSIGSAVSLSISPETINGFWDKVLEQNPQLEGVEPVSFFHAFGLYCLYVLIANIFSLVGVIMMWRLERIGFFIYALAELSTNFIRMSVTVEGESGIGGMILGIVIDLIFIGMFLANLKHMKKKNNNNFIQSGS